MTSAAFAPAAPMPTQTSTQDLKATQTFGAAVPTQGPQALSSDTSVTATSKTEEARINADVAEERRNEMRFEGHKETDAAVTTKNNAAEGRLDVYKKVGEQDILLYSIPGESPDTPYNHKDDAAPTVIDRAA